jgi:Arc/MetJ-type ribon-helix-helix transcriptional regulator
MGRPPKPEKEKVGVTLTIRLSADDKAMLDELVRKRAERLAGEGVEVSASSVIRALIRQAEDLDAAGRKPKP